ncbi:MAG: phosphonate C-P lyase system protein PhnH [Xanthobacteraceae bacterium]
MLAAGFSDPVLSAQSTFRTILDAMSHPGRVLRVTTALSPPQLLSPAAAAVALTLCDHDTPVWLDAELRASDDILEWLRFHCGCELVDESRRASFAFINRSARLPRIDEFNAGSDDYPDRSATVVVRVETLASGPGLVLNGPGIRDRETLRAKPLPDDMAARLVFNRSLFPRGIDMLLVTDSAIAALPRSVRVLEGN